MGATLILMTGFDKEFLAMTTPSANEPVLAIRGGPPATPPHAGQAGLSAQAGAQVAAALAVGVIPEIAEPTPSVEEHEHTYIQIHSSCGPYFEAECVNVRRGPGEEFGVITSLRNGVVLETLGPVEANGRTWHHVVFNEPIRYPERVPREWYVAAEFTRPFLNEGALEISAASAETNKRIVIDRTEQKLYAYDGEALFMEQTISTGIELTPTPRGTFSVYKKTPSRYMQGPLPGVSEKYYDLPGVPWNLYFTHQGAVIHGAYWHDKFGQPWSNGCVNLPVATAETLYEWADLGTTVIVQN